MGHHKALTAVFNSIICYLDKEPSINHKHFCKLTCKVIDSWNTLDLNLWYYILSLKTMYNIRTIPITQRGFKVSLATKA